MVKNVQDYVLEAIEQENRTQTTKDKLLNWKNPYYICDYSTKGFEGCCSQFGLRLYTSLSW